jgi:hypothetical protein
MAPPSSDSVMDCVAVFQCFHRILNNLLERLNSRCDHVLLSVVFVGPSHVLFTWEIRGPNNFVLWHCRVGVAEYEMLSD